MGAYELLCDQIERDIERLNGMTSGTHMWDSTSEREQLEGGIEIKIAILQGLEHIDSLEFPETDFGTAAGLEI